MPSRSDLVYFRQREQECREKAANANDPAIERVHQQFAERYNQAASKLGQVSTNAA
jgi:hypothetical protein